jgi:hypothetical protein
VASAWRGHYERLHLHTSRRFSGLPHLPMPASFPDYPSREQVIEYLETYARDLGLRPQFGKRVLSIRRNGEAWVTATANGGYRSRNVVIATGNTRRPKVPSWPDQETYAGEILHSSRYMNGGRWRGRAVLVVGFGNSGGEIALDLCEHGCRPTLAVRSPVNVIPRDVLGVPILAIGILMSLLPPAMADVMAKPLLAMSIGDIRKLGLRRLPYGPNRQIAEHGRIPLIDIGTIGKIRSGEIALAQGLRRFTPRGVVFDDDRDVEFDAVILATGYEPALGELLPDSAHVLDERGAPRASGHETDPGLYFCGFYVAPTGMLREIGIEADRIASSIAGARG